MLASLLPGLRDLRTPLTVGYLWLLFGWFSFGDALPRSDPRDGGVVSRTYELVGILGAPAAVAALSFAAYVIGAIVTLPTEGGLATSLLRRLEPRVHGRGPGAEHRLRARLRRLLSSADEPGTRSEFDRRLKGIRAAAAELPADVRRRVGFPEGPRGEELVPPLSDLRDRLLAMNQDMYGEYDRYAAEASFRLNVVPPLLALSAVVAVDLGSPLPGLVVPVWLVLLVQGVNRLQQARMVLWRAVITEKITLPAEDRLQEARELTDSARRPSRSLAPAALRRLLRTRPGTRG